MSSFIGILSGAALLFIAIFEQGGAGVFLNIHAVMIVFGGITAALIISYPLPTVIKVFGVLFQIFRREIESPAWVIMMMVKFAKKARQSSLLSLDEDIKQIHDKTFRVGVRMVVDGLPPEMVRETLEIEMASLRTRHQDGERIFRTASKLAPAFGLVGTLIGLIAMLRSLSGAGAADSVGPGMAVAMVATFYGAMSSNLLFGPIAEKLRARSEAELMRNRMILAGLLMIQLGINPRLIESKLNAYLPPEQRTRLYEKSG